MVCGECQQRLSSNDFYASNQASCKACVKARAAARRRANPHANRRAAAAWRERQRLRQELLEDVLQRLVATTENGRRRLLEAMQDAEDARGLPAGTFEDLLRKREPRNF